MRNVGPPHEFSSKKLMRGVGFEPQFTSRDTIGLAEGKSKCLAFHRYVLGKSVLGWITHFGTEKLDSECKLLGINRVNCPPKMNHFAQD
jgi:hypothetical protein